MSVVETLDKTAGEALVGRTAWVPSAGQVGTVQGCADDVLVVLIDGDPVACSMREAAVVPSTGQQCPGAEEVTWLSFVEGGDTAVTGWVFDARTGAAARRSVDLLEATAWSMITRRAEDREVALMKAVKAAEAGEERVEQIVAVAHEKADEHDLCHVFDDWMDALGLPRRKRSYSVSVQVWVTLQREATDSEEAEDVELREVITQLQEMARDGRSVDMTATVD